MIDGLLRLPADVVLTPVDELPADTLQKLDYKTGDFALTRPQSRTPSRIVNGDTAKLLEGFREPTTVVDAVIRFSKSENIDARETLENAFPVLNALFNVGLLLSPDSELARPIEFSWSRDDHFGALRILAPVDVVLDTEVYLAQADDGSYAAIKVARPGAGSRMTRLFRHEAAILGRLDGKFYPKMFACGELDGRAYLATSWCTGVDAYVAASLARGLGPLGQAELSGIVNAIGEAYAHLHSQGVVHGDVHARNVILGSDGRAALIDFGLARDVRTKTRTFHRGRGVVDLYMEPELALARRDGLPSPPACELGEQYSVAALLYFLLTGVHTHDFVLEEQEMFRQLVEENPRSFCERGIDAYQHTEQVLMRALEKRPEARHSSMHEFRISLRAALRADNSRRVTTKATAGGAIGRARGLLDEVIERSKLSAPLIEKGLEAPSASINCGAAGLAYAILRIAQHREDEDLLALADVWSSTATRAIRKSPERALSCPDLELTPALVGKVSLYHSSVGVHCVEALVANARADEAQRIAAVESFVEAGSHDDQRVELAFGIAGTLLGCSLLLEALHSPSPLEKEPILRLGRALNAQIIASLEELPPIGEQSSLTHLGMAHGWAGALYSLLHWARCSTSPVPDLLPERLNQLASLARPSGRGLYWPATSGLHSGTDVLRATWCNGAAGHVYLWTLAHKQLGHVQYEELAAGAAWTAYELAAAGGDLCCGLGGRAYALLHYFRHCGDVHWIDRASHLANRAAVEVRAQSLRPNALYKGEIGVALLAADLEYPERACMPLFESEGWPERQAR